MIKDCTRIARIQKIQKTEEIFGGGVEGNEQNLTKEKEVETKHKSKAILPFFWDYFIYTWIQMR